MFKNRLIIGVSTLVSVMLLSGCGEYEKLLKSRDFEKKYETAVKLYEEGEFAKAGTLFDQVANIYGEPPKQIQLSITRQKVILVSGII